MGAEMTGSCCSPSRDAGEPRPPVRAEAAAGAVPSHTLTGTMIRLDGARFRMGSEDRWAYPADGEVPERMVALSPFAIDRFPVTNEAFSAFVDGTGHVTDAERFGWSFVFAGLLPDDFVETRGVREAPWWRQVFGADWRHPSGPQDAAVLDHPVVHVSWTDAAAFARWAGKRLPTEAEWEFAARGGIERAPFPWGDELEPGGEHRMNVWQGTFPAVNTLDDGFLGTSPVGSYPPNGYGLFDATGNVWEWVADHFATDHRSDEVVDPTGPSASDRRVQRGGSYLCHASYCRRYRVSARMGSTPDSTTGNVGFRCAKSTAPTTSANLTQNQDPGH